MIALLLKGVPIKGQPGLQLVQTLKGKKWKRITKKESIKKESSVKNLLQDMEKFQRVELGHDYPRAVALLDLHKRLENAKGDNAIKKITSDIDSYITKGIGWGKHPKEEKAIKAFYDYAIEKRKTAFKKVNTKNVDALINKFKEHDKALGGGSKIIKNALRQAGGIKNLMEKPHIIGLYEQTQFGTLKKEISHEVGMIKKDLRRGGYGYMVEESTGKLINAVTDISKALVNMNPTEAQKEAGNYKKKHIRFEGMDISLENPAGSYRQGTSPDGKKWKTLMKHNYGYIKGTKGYDKDHVDVFIKPKTRGGKSVYVINQCDPKTGKFDECKVMLAFDNEAEAKKAYLSNYEKGWKGLKSITPMPMFHFKDWVYSNQPRKGEVKRPTVKGKDISNVSYADYSKTAAVEVAKAGAMVNEEAGKEFYNFYQKNKPLKKSIILFLDIYGRN